MAGLRSFPWLSSCSRVLAVVDNAAANTGAHVRRSALRCVLLQTKAQRWPCWVTRPPRRSLRHALGQRSFPLVSEHGRPEGRAVPLGGFGLPASTAVI